MGPEEAPAVSELARSVFAEFVAPLYSARGHDEFMRFSAPQNIMSHRHEVFVAENTASHELTGMLLLRDQSHIGMLFVRKAHQRKGIGKQLIGHAEHLCRIRSGEKLTVNAAPNSVGSYRAYGFLETGREREVHGIRFTPMQKVL